MDKNGSLLLSTSSTLIHASSVSPKILAFTPQTRPLDTLHEKHSYSQHLVDYNFNYGGYSRNLFH